MKLYFAPMRELPVMCTGMPIIGGLEESTNILPLLSYREKTAISVQGI